MNFSRISNEKLNFINLLSSNVIIQFSHHLFHFFLIFYSAKLLRLEEFSIFSKIIYTVAILHIFIEYSYRINGTNFISYNLNQKNLLEKKINSVFFLQILICIFFLPIFYIYSIIFLKIEFYLSFIVYLSIIFNSLFPQWFILGARNSEKFLLHQFFSKLIGVLIIIFFQPSKLYLFIYLILFINFFNFFFAVLIIKKIFKFKIIRVPIKDIYKEFKNGLFLFIGLVFNNFSNQVIPFVVISISNPLNILSFTLADKLRKISQLVVAPLLSILFPHLSNSKNKRKSDLKRHKIYFTICVLILMIVILIVILFIAEDLVYYIANKNNEDIFRLLLILSVSPILWFLNEILGQNTLYLIQEKKFNQINIISGIMATMLSSILFFYKSIYLAAMLIILIEFFKTCLYVITLIKIRKYEN